MILLFNVFIINSITIQFPQKRRKEEKKENELGFIFIPDTALENPENNELDYSRIAEELAKKIANIKKESSFSIGLVAPWRYGKTTFLNFQQNK